MQGDTGRIFDPEELKQIKKMSDEQVALDDRAIELSKMFEITKDQHEEMKPMSRRSRKNWMRNKPCVCGSGKKFKRCCWFKYK